jgi:hypothetical protein
MILPTKHIDISRSLIGLGAEVLKCIDRPETVSTLWQRAALIREIGTFETFTLTLDFLYAIGAIEFEDNFIRKVV